MIFRLNRDIQQVIFTQEIRVNATMSTQGLKKIIIEDLKKLSLGQQKKVHDFARALLVSKPSGVKGIDLVRFANLFDAKTIAGMKSAIKKGCEEIDRDEW